MEEDLFWHMKGRKEKEWKCLIFYKLNFLPFLLTYLVMDVVIN